MIPYFIYTLLAVYILHCHLLDHVRFDIVQLWVLRLWSCGMWHCIVWYHMIAFMKSHSIKTASLCWYLEGQKHKDSLKCGSSEGTIHEIVNVLEFHVGQFRPLWKTIRQSELVSDHLPNSCLICCVKSSASLWMSAKKKIKLLSF